MVSSLFFSLIFLAAGILWVWVIKPKKRQIALPLVLLVGLMPPALVTFTMWGAAQGFGDIRIALEGFYFDLDRMGDKEISVGGSKQDDHLFVRDLPKGFLRLQLEGNQLVLKIHQDESARESGNFAAVRTSTSSPFHNAVPLVDGASLQFGKTGPELVFNASERLFHRKETLSLVPGVPIERRRNRGLPVLKNLPAGIRNYPLRFYGLALPKGDDRPVLRLQDGRAIGSFLGWSGLLNKDPYLVITDPELVINQGEETFSFQNEVHALQDGKGIGVHLYRLDYKDNRGGRGGRVSRAQERRSFFVQYREDRVEITLDTPVFVHLKGSELKQVQRRARTAGNSEPLTLTLADDRYFKVDDHHRIFLDFGIVGNQMEHELFSAIAFSYGKDHDLRVTTHQGRFAYDFGQGIAIGDKTGLKMRVDHLALPWPFLVVLWVVALTALASGLELRAHPIPFLLLSGMELFLGLRILIAFQAAALDTAVLKDVWSSLATYAVATFVIQAGLMLFRDGWRLKPLALPNPLLLTQLGITLVVLLVILGATPIPKMKGLVLIFFTVCSPFGLWLLYKLLDQIAQELQKPRWKKPLFLVLLIGVLFFFRIGTLVVFGWKERMVFPGGIAIAVSMYYTPAAIFIAGLLWLARDKLKTHLLWLYPVFLFLIFLVAPFLARDHGVALIFPMPVLLLFCLPLFTQMNLKNRQGMLLAAPLVIYCAVPLVLPLLGWVVRPGWDQAQVQRALTEEGAARQLLEARVDESHNELRFWSQAAPERLREIGTAEAESLALVMDNLSIYSGQGPLGRGYLGTALSGTLRQTHLNDNVSAIHVLSTYGWVGGGLFLLVTLTWSLLPLRLLRGKTLTELVPVRAAWGMMLLITISFSALYMFSANTQMVLFTGKNVYFLAAASLSDAAESCLLVALAAWALDDIGVRRRI